MSGSPGVFVRARGCNKEVLSESESESALRSVLLESGAPGSGAVMASLEEEVQCTVCCDIFTEPVLLSCSHSFCRKCLQQVWSKGRPECPLCRRRSSKEFPPLNLALKHVCDLLRKREVKRLNAGVNCDLHQETLCLFCRNDQRPVCVSCVSSTKHKGHEFCRLTEAVQEKRDELEAALHPLKEKVENLEKIQHICTSTAKYIKSQADNTEAQIKQEFAKLHSFLRKEEAERIAKLRQEEEQKSQTLQETMQTINRKLESLSETIKTLEYKMKTEDVPFLQSFSQTKTMVQDTLQDPGDTPVPLIDVAKHLNVLKYQVWEKMLGIVQYVPLCLDPLSAHAQLSLSEELTSVSYSHRGKGIPGNPERFDPYVFVLGAEGYDGGTHSWEVEVGNKANCRIGVARGSVQRKGHFSVCPKEGLYTIVFRKREFHAGTFPETRLDFKKKPQRIKVCLSYDKGEVTFTDPSDGTVIYIFKDTFTERLYPLFGPAKDSAPLRICPMTVSVSY
ncbi:E3 ubiquitin-protein ligase TRIM21 [Astyanax mexicanus]|uniref:E3 ubiquitin-protein ligase TRIM21 n=2 Tax=Astyanax mexicanus TaxID=7994 RepID=UPI0020CAD9D4|nr:E3 ubiquitin-protein ligase TRIM21 [Astyanax mexicanus]